MLDSNVLKVSLPLTALTMVGILIGQTTGSIAGIVLSGVGMAVVCGAITWFAERLILRMAGARTLAAQDAPWLVELVAELAHRARLPMPDIATIDSPNPNAFAVGRTPKQGVVVLTVGITQLLTRDELASVVAHELAHIRHRDTCAAAVVTTLAGVVLFPATLAPLRQVLLVILTPLAAAFIRLGMAWPREYKADLLGAELVGDPLPLASALEKIDWAAQQMPLQANPALSSLYTVNPLVGQHPILRLLNTHPPTPQRVARLRALAHQR